MNTTRRSVLLGVGAAAIATPSLAVMPPLPTFRGSNIHGDPRAGTAHIDTAFLTARSSGQTGLFRIANVVQPGFRSNETLAILDQGRIVDLHARIPGTSTYLQRGASTGIRQLPGTIYQSLMSFGLDTPVAPAQRQRFLDAVNGASPAGHGTAPSCPANFASMSAKQKAILGNDPRYSSCIRSENTAPRHFALLDIWNELFGIEPAAAADWLLVELSYDGSDDAPGLSYYSSGDGLCGFTGFGVTAIWLVFG